MQLFLNIGQKNGIKNFNKKKLPLKNPQNITLLSEIVVLQLATVIKRIPSKIFYQNFVKLLQHLFSGHSELIFPQNLQCLCPKVFIINFHSFISNISFLIKFYHYLIIIILQIRPQKCVSKRLPVNSSNSDIICSKAEGRMKARQIFRKTNISYPLIRTHRG